MGAVNYEKKIKSPTFTNTEKFIWNLNHDFSLFLDFFLFILLFVEKSSIRFLVFEFWLII
ncbi:hypothetical protein RhiirA5_154326 [Rhizophagus irregularis]|uniref:Uncharacterized protein n=1 Tax=Rhizophagus irregularis TaxID=588596 RepID=A0A2N0PS21_9GLOM|nr:hypothetical protein RhiirA5_154326 [Rhizophagus irregularis]